MRWRRANRLIEGAVALYTIVFGVAVVRGAADQSPAPPTSLISALPSTRTGADIYRLTCATCHGPDGKGSPLSVVGFDQPLPDFTDCAFATAEPDPDWQAVVHRGGPIRGLDRHMPQFGDALSSADIANAVTYLRTFCKAAAWPQGDLNFPRAFFTEKAFPENEAVWTTAIVTRGRKTVANELLYERRFGARNQIELVLPIDFLAANPGVWTRGIGDLAFAFRRTLYASMTTGRIAAAGAELVVPTGSEARGLGSGVTIVEPFAMWGQMLPRNAFLQMHGGIELPSNLTKASKEAFIRTSVGQTFASDDGFGRSWSPQVELLWAKPGGEASEWDVVPQLQVSLSKLQHVLVAGGVKIPISQRSERRSQLVVYLLWDWFDGSFFDFWK